MLVTVSVYTRAADNRTYQNSRALSEEAFTLARALPHLELGPGTLERVEVTLKDALDASRLEYVCKAFSMAGIEVLPVHRDGAGGALALVCQDGTLAKTDWPEFDAYGWSHWMWKSPACIASETRRKSAIARFFAYYSDDADADAPASEGRRDL
jgi:hypothetical protein